MARNIDQRQRQRMQSSGRAPAKAGEASSNKQGVAGDSSPKPTVKTSFKDLTYNFKTGRVE